MDGSIVSIALLCMSIIWLGIILGGIQNELRQIRQALERGENE